MDASWETKPLVHNGGSPSCILADFGHSHGRQPNPQATWHRAELGHATNRKKGKQVMLPQSLRLSHVITSNLAVSIFSSSISVAFAPKII